MKIQGGSSPTMISEWGVTLLHLYGKHRLKKSLFFSNDNPPPQQQQQQHEIRSLLDLPPRVKKKRKTSRFPLDLSIYRLSKSVREHRAAWSLGATSPSAA